MNDIDLAKEVLEKNKCTLVIVKKGAVVFLSHDKGIKPIYTAICNIKEKLNGASVADRVIGRAAAILYRCANIKELHTKIISKGAVEVLKSSNIAFNYQEMSLYIKNRDKTDMCPVEKLSQDIDSPIFLLEKIKQFLESIKDGDK